VRRGDIHRLRSAKGTGHEQQGVRFAVVIQADSMLPRSVVVIAPTSRSARPASFRPPVEVDGTTTKVLVEHVAAVDVQRLGRRVGRLDPEEQWAVDDALALVLGLG